MKKIIIICITLVLMAGAALADTLYLKNGSVLKGNFVGYENGQFIFELEGGRQMKFRAADVARLVIERVSQPGDPYPSRDPVPNWESYPSVNVPLEDQWIRSQINLTRGQKIKVQATGTVYLEGRTQTGPDGLNGRRDQDAPMPDENDGALIAAIGQDPNSPAILIGRNREFTANQDGMLYFTVNHWETRNARGAYRVNVSVDKNSPTNTDAGSSTGRGIERTFTIRGDQEWIDTGIEVEPNMTFEISAEGEVFISDRISSDPDGNRDAMGRNSVYPVQDAGVGALIGKIRYRNGRDSNVIFIGRYSRPRTEANEYGRLMLGINDDVFRDNKGSYRVTIRW